MFHSRVSPGNPPHTDQKAAVLLSFSRCSPLCPLTCLIPSSHVLSLSPLPPSPPPPPSSPSQGWVFPVVWSTLYVLMGIASWMVWKHGGEWACPWCMVHAVDCTVHGEPPYCQMDRSRSDWVMWREVEGVM